MAYNSAENEAVAEDGGPNSGFVKSLDRGLAVIRAFSEESSAMTLSDVARKTGLTRASARRFLHTLQALGYASSDGRFFRLEPRVLDLGYSYLSSLPVWGVAEQHMVPLVEALHESSSVTVLDGDEIVYVVRVPTKRIMTISLSVGSRLPAYPTSMGRVLLAQMPPDALDSYLERIELEPLTNKTVTDPDELRAILKTTRDQGWVIVDQELEDGVRSMSAPLRGAGNRVIAALNVSGHASRVSLSTMRSTFLPHLLETAEKISIQLRHHRG
jgi:IclR family pca regulon transcriptional regulator